VIGPGAHVGARADVRSCVLGAGARVPDGMTIADARVDTDTEAAPAQSS
jgi:ADP-glucose pyrophosphorylase